MPVPRQSSPRKPATLPVQQVDATRTANGVQGPVGLGLVAALAAHLAAKHQQRTASSTRTGTNAPDPYSQMQQRQGIGAFTQGGMQ